jgi:hypothetical protein
MSESEMVEAAELDVYPDAAAAMTEAGDGWFGTELAVGAAGGADHAGSVRAILMLILVVDAKGGNHG